MKEAAENFHEWNAARLQALQAANHDRRCERARRGRKRKRAVPGDADDRAPKMSTSNTRLLLPDLLILFK